MDGGGLRRPFRRTQLVGLVVLAALGATFLATSPASGEASRASAAPFNNGAGTASALGYKVNPVFGNLSFGITTGVSIAGHQNTVAQGISKVYDLGVIGTTLAAEPCDGGEPTYARERQPQPLIAESSDPAYANGERVAEDWNGIPAGSKFARADSTPFAQAITDVAPLGDDAVAKITGARTVASSGIVNGTIREAKAITEIDELSFFDGAIKLGDMRWEATQRTGTATSNVGTFELGSLTVQGQRHPLPADQAGQLEALNEVLVPLGFQLRVPNVKFEQGIVFVSPMKIGIIPSDLREDVLGPLFGALQRPRQSFTDALIELDCSNGTYITIADIALGSFSGAGALNLELGGVQATTRAITGFQGLGEFTPLPPLTPPPSVTVPAATPTTVTAEVSTTTAAVDEEEPEREVAAAPISDDDGARGGALAAVSAIGLLALLASAEADRRKMRRSLRLLPTEV